MASSEQLRSQVLEAKHAPLLLVLLLQLLLQQMVQSQCLIQGHPESQDGRLHALPGLKPQVENEYATSQQTPCPAHFPGQHRSSLPFTLGSNMCHSLISRLCKQSCVSAA